MTGETSSRFSPGQSSLTSLLRAVVPVACVLSVLIVTSTVGASPPEPGISDGTCRETTAQFFPPEKLQDLDGGGQRIRYRCGPIDVTPGQNRIEWPSMELYHHRPDQAGWITRLQPDMVDCDAFGKCEALPSDQVMFHHAVWLNEDQRDRSAPKEFPQYPQRFFGAGEEKTTLELPKGYGYRYEPNDRWTLNHMLHSLVNARYELYIQYDIDFFPLASQAGGSMKEAEPLWLDVQNGSAYPVFDVFRGQGKKGQFTYPSDAKKNPYEDNNFRVPLNQWEVDRHGYLLWTAGHVHSGGLWTDLDLIRENASYQGPNCGPRARRFKKKRRALARLDRKIARVKKGGGSRKRLARLGKQRKRMVSARNKARKGLRTCRSSRPRVKGNRVELFRSNAKYFDRPGRKAKPTSWDMAMYNTTPSWRPQLRPGDKLEITTTYETKLGSWYESMGINFLFMARCNPDEGRTCGEDPYRTRQDNRKRLNHGPLPENDFHGGKEIPGAPDPRQLPASTASTQPLLIGDWSYQESDLWKRQVVSVRQGEKLEFKLDQPDIKDEIWHSITSCEPPCNRSTGISYPIPDGRFRFDSGQLGKEKKETLAFRPTNGTVGRTSWNFEAKANMDPGTYTFFCRIHPSMRGALRVLPKSK